jgi:hypothetical protein
MKNLYLLIVITISLPTNALDCGTPVECYVKAIDALHQAREEYNTAKDKLTAIIDTVKAGLEKTIADDVNKLTKMIDAQNDINTNFNTKINQLDERLRNVNCRDVYSNCRDDEKGLIYNFYRHLIMCNGDEHMRGWSLQDCANDQIRIYYSCCKHP